MSSDRDKSSNKSNSLRKSGNASNQNFKNTEPGNSSELNNEFADYLEYVRSLKSENETLKASKEEILTSCNTEICTVKTTYGSEIDALRKALDESTKEKYTTDYHNDKLLEENNNLKIKFARKLDAFNELEKKYEEADSNLTKTMKSIEQYNNLCVENNDMSRKILLLTEQLKSENSKRIDVESRILTLNDEVTFLKKINSSNSLSAREISTSSNNRAEAYYSEKFNEKIASLREEMTKEFDQYKAQIDKTYSKKIEELSAENSKINEKCNRLFYEKKALQNENDTLHSNLTVLESKVAVLTTRDSRHLETISKINVEHHNFIRDIIEENSELKEKVKESGAKITSLMNDKIAQEKEAYIFRSMLKGEQSRVNLTDGNNQKRKLIDNDEPEISAWSRNSIKLICDVNCNGNYVQIINDGINDVDINEWSLNIERPSGCDGLYTFAPRKVGAGRSLNVWSLGEDVIEDEDNLIMNVCFPPVSDIKSCRLHNDMDETEASFELKMPAVRRKILKVNSSKRNENAENCSMM